MAQRSSEPRRWSVWTVLMAGIALGAVLRDQAVIPIAVSAAQERPMIAEDAYFGIKPGMMIPYFGAGDTPPKGFVFADGKATWPHADWVPKHLREDKDGKPTQVHVPDMRGRLLGGAISKDEVATVFDKGQLTIDGDAFKVSTVSEEKDAKLTNTHALLGEFDGKLFDTGVAFIPGAKLKHQTAPKYTEKSPGKITVERPVKLSDNRNLLPAHMMVQWIIRVE